LLIHCLRVAEEMGLHWYQGRKASMCKSQELEGAVSVWSLYVSCSGCLEGHWGSLFTSKSCGELLMGWYGKDEAIALAWWDCLVESHRCSCSLPTPSPSYGHYWVQQCSIESHRPPKVLVGSLAGIKGPQEGHMPGEKELNHLLGRAGAPC